MSIGLIILRAEEKEKCIMIISYEHFIEVLNQKIKFGLELYIELLQTIIKNPQRYCGIFRVSNAKTKLIQNVTQSQEIKFGDFLEDIVTEYIGILGYENKEKNLGEDADGNVLNADQVFVSGGTVYFVEQKVRDDHDSTKKRGQFANFTKKIRRVKELYPDKHLVAIMWFCDDGLRKNRRYYQGEMENASFDNTELHLYYGAGFLHSIQGGTEVWDEIVSYLTRYRMEHVNYSLTIPDFGTSQDIYDALVALPSAEWRKLVSDDPTYCSLREELFSNGNNIERARTAREN